MFSHAAMSGSLTNKIQKWFCRIIMMTLTQESK